MKNKTKIISLILFFFCSFYLVAQDLSYPTKVIDGKEYYIYAVKAGEGLYSISKKFGLSQADINNANSQIVNGVKAGEAILIPKKPNATKLPPAKAERKVEYKGDYIMHKVEKKQTLFAISRLYNVTQDEILEANPQLSRGLQANEVIRIPQKGSASKKEEKTEPRSPSTSIPANSNLHINDKGAYISHQVQPGETLYAISRKYNVTVQEIISLNPTSETTLKIGSSLKIPVTTAAEQKPIQKKPTVKTFKKDRYKIAYLLPFMLEDAAADPTVHKFMEFYMGSLLAIRQAQNNGISYDIYTYDTGKSEEKIHAIINKPEFQQMDLIIGPAYSMQIPMLTDFAKRREIYTVVPFSANVSDMDDNPYVFQFNPDKDLQSYFLMSALRSKFQTSNVLMIKLENAFSDGENETYRMINEKLETSKTYYKRLTKADLSANPIEKYLDTNKKNILIFDSERISAVQPYLNTLYDLSTKYDVAVVGQYNWKGEVGKKPKMYYVAPFIDDASRAAAATDYETEYNTYYGKLRGDKNPRFDMIGYDITKYFLSLLGKNGVKINENTQMLKTDGIQSGMYFKRVGSNGGFMNQQLYLIEDAPKRN